MTRVGLALAVVVLAPFTLSAQEKYTIKISRTDKAGDRSHVTTNDTEVGSQSVTSADGTVLFSKSTDDARTATYEETIVEKAAGKKPAKIVRKFEKVTFKPNKKETETGLAGKAVVIERKAGKVGYKYEDGGDLSPAGVQFLSREFKDGSDDESSFEKWILPKNPVAVGDTWKCDLPELLKDFSKDSGNKIDAATATATGKLLKAYSKDGKQFGEIEVMLDFPIVETKGPTGAIKADAGSRFKIKVSFDGCIDGSRNEGTARFHMDVKLNAKVPGPGGDMVTLAVTAINDRTKTAKELDK